MWPRYGGHVYHKEIPVTVQPLVDTTGSPVADRTIQAIVRLLDLLLPNALCSCYVEGSYATQTAVATSDLDLIFVLHSPLATEHEHMIASTLLGACQDLSSLELDVTLTDITQLRQVADPMFKLGARLLVGHEIRDTIPLMPIQLWARQRMHAAFWLMIHVFQRPQPVVAPLTFPAPDAPFYGYAARRMQLPDGTVISTTRNLIRVTGWIATARIAYEAHSYVVEKRASVTTYRELIGDEWTSLLETLDRLCRTAWHYRIPKRRAEQAELRTIATQVLAYENHFLAVYSRFVLDELTNGDTAGQLTALTMLAQTWYPEPTLLARLDQLLEADHNDIRTAAKYLIEQWQNIVSASSNEQLPRKRLTECCSATRESN